MIKEKTPGHVEFFKYPFNQQKSRIVVLLID